MFENPRRGRQARNFTANAPKILDLKSSSEQIFSRKLPLGAPENTGLFMIVEFKILWYYELTIPCVAFEKSFNVCLVFPRSRTLQIDQNRSSKT